MARQQSLVLTAVEKKEKIALLKNDIHYTKFEIDNFADDAKVAKENAVQTKKELKRLEQELEDTRKVRAKRVRK